MDERITADAEEREKFRAEFRAKIGAEKVG